MNREKESHYRRSVREDGNWKIIDSGGRCTVAVIILNLKRYSTDDNIFFIFILYVIYNIFIYFYYYLYIIYNIYLYISYIWQRWKEVKGKSEGEENDKTVCSKLIIFIKNKL